MSIPLFSRHRARGAVLATSILALGAIGGSAMQVTAQTPAPVPASSWTQPAELADLIEEVSPAVVKITATRSARQASPGAAPSIPDEMLEGPFGEMFRRYFDRMPDAERGAPSPRRGSALGSGFILSEDGIVVTNNHVIDGADELVVTLRDGREFTGVLLGVDPRTDLAVLRIEADEALPHVAWGTSDVVRVGDPVFAVGAPFGLSGTVTAGIVSARGREIGAGPYDDFIQIDAPINRGNSGGPLFDASGEVIGVNTAIFSPSGGNVGIGFSIPSDMARSIVAEIVENGGVERGWLGVSIQSVTPDIADSLGLGSPSGAIVASVVDDSPAEASGVRSGDVIVAFAGLPVEDAGDLSRAVGATDPGDTAPLTVFRQGETLTLDVTVAMLDADMAEAGAQPSAPAVDPDALGLALAQGPEGVTVRDVDPDSPAAVTAGIRAGDVIVSVNQRPVETVEDVTRAVTDARDEGRPSLLAQVSRAGLDRFVVIPFAAS